MSENIIFRIQIFMINIIKEMIFLASLIIILYHESKQFSVQGQWSGATSKVQMDLQQKCLTNILQWQKCLMVSLLCQKCLTLLCQKCLTLLCQICLTVSLQMQLVMTCMTRLMWSMTRPMWRCRLKKDPSLEWRIFSWLQKENYIRSVWRCSLWFCFGMSLEHQGRMRTL